MRKVVVFRAEGCHLCERAVEVVESVRAVVAFDLEVIDIGDDPELEARYRVLLPVIEIDGEPAFTFEVDAAELRALVS